MRINVFFIVCFPKGATRRLQARVCFAGRRDFATVARVTPEFFDSLPFIHETSLQPIPKRSTRLRPDCCIGDSPMLIPGHASGMMWKRAFSGAAGVASTLANSKNFFFGLIAWFSQCWKLKMSQIRNPNPEIRRNIEIQTSNE